MASEPFISPDGCTKCGGEYPLTFFRLKRGASRVKPHSGQCKRSEQERRDGMKWKVRVSHRPVCKRCEQERRDGMKRRNRPQILPQFSFPSPMAMIQSK
jgi:hypothetical protein